MKMNAKKGQKEARRGKRLLFFSEDEETKPTTLTSKQKCPIEKKKKKIETKKR